MDRRAPPPASLPVPARAGPKSGGGASAGSGVTTPGRHRAPRASRARRVGDLRDRGLDQHVDRPAARQPDVPCLLVADPVADHPRAAGLPRGPLDLLGGGALDAAAADGARDPAVVGVTSRTAPSGRGALPNVRTTTARPTPDVPGLGAPGVQRCPAARASAGTSGPASGAADAPSGRRPGAAVRAARGGAVSGGRRSPSGRRHGGGVRDRRPAPRRIPAKPPPAVSPRRSARRACRPAGSRR